MAEITPTSRLRMHAEYVCAQAPEIGERTGQLLFNSLRHEIAEVVRGTMLDTFYREMSFQEVYDWLTNHLVYDYSGNMICLFDGQKILWEA